MKVFVIADARGDVRSVAIPNPELAAQVGMEAEDGGRVHRVEMRGRTAGRDQVLNPRTEAARRRLYARLRAMIARTPAAATRAGKPRRRRGRGKSSKDLP